MSALTLSLALASILGCGGKDSAKSSTGKVDLHALAVKGDLVALRQALDAGCPVDQRDDRGATPLDSARNGEIASLLLDHGADANAKDKDGWTPAHSAAYFGRVDVLLVLAARGAKLDEPDSIKDARPIHCARDIKTLEVLLSHGADVNARIRDGTTILFGAVGNGRKDMVDWLIAKGADVNARDAEGAVPLHCATDPEIANLLVKAGADINAQQSNGATPLHVVIFKNRFKNFMPMVQFLLNTGADSSIPDKDGTTPKAYAEQIGRKDIVELIEKRAPTSRGADATSRPFSRSIP